MRRVLLNALLGFAACASVSQNQVPPATAQMPDASAAPTPGRAPDGGGPRDGGRPDGAGRGIVPGAGDRGVEADFGAARARFDAGDQNGARAALEAFVAAHPDHPSRSQAEILLARLALTRSDNAAAKKLLDPLAAGPDAGVSPPAAPSGSGLSTATSARYYLGLAEARLGNAVRARTLLLPFLPKAGPDPAPTDDAAIELRGALAEATAPSDPIAALELWEGYARVGRDSEKAWARLRASEIAARVPPESAWRAYGAAPPSGLIRAVLGARAASYLRGRGDAAGAAFIETESNAARHSVGFDVAGSHVGPGDPTRIGLAIPLSGKFQVVGEAALRAAMLAGATAAPPGPGAPAGAQLVVRDTATDADRAARGVVELTRTEAVIGIVGAASAKTGTSAITQATQDGIAVLALEDVAPGALTTAFQIVHAPEARAAALARQALNAGVRKFAMVGPDSAGGKRMREAFRKAVVAGGGTIAVDSSYVAGATSFSGAIAPLKRASIEAIFVPDSADRLALIAPALAVADLWPQPWTKSRPAGKVKDQPRPVLLLSTANELSHKLLDTAGRYVQGALLCPGFFADDADPRARGFVEAYRTAYGLEPHATEAYTYDAVATLRAVTGRGARTRGDVVKALGAAGSPALLQGLTGNIAFGPDHGRVDSPLVYVVAGDEIRAAK